MELKYLIDKTSSTVNGK